LWLSDGNLYLSKCFHYALRPYINYKTNSIEYDAISSEKIFKMKNPSDNKYNSIQGLPPSEARRTLGVIIAPDGKGSTQLRHSILKTKEFFAKISNASLSSKAKWTAIMTMIEPAILYPLVNVFFSSKEIQPLDSLTSRMKCQALWLNRNFPRAILHRSTMLEGIGIPSSS
jgi:hypothetical protein